MNFNEFNTAEMSRRFSSTYVYNYDLESPVYIEGFPDLHTIHFSPIGEDMTSGDFIPEEWDLTYPPLGFLPFGEYSIYLSRIPSRQYRYGYDYRHVRYKAVYGDIPSMYMKPLPSSLRQTDILNKIFDRNIDGRYKSFSEAYKMITNKSSLSVPLGYNWALTTSITHKEPLLWNGHLSTVVGLSPSEDTIYIPSESDFLYEEITNTINDVEVRLK